MIKNILAGLGVFYLGLTFSIISWIIKELRKENPKHCWFRFKRHKFGKPYKKNPKFLTLYQKCEVCYQVTTYKFKDE